MGLRGGMILSQNGIQGLGWKNKSQLHRKQKMETTIQGLGLRVWMEDNYGNCCLWLRMWMEEPTA